jgi:RNA polymerase sigma factor (sigma-70 family)
MAEPDGHTAVLQFWLERLAEGDETAGRQARDRVLEHTAGRLERLARRMLRAYPRLRRWEQTGDVLQNAALRLQRALAELRPRSAREFYALAATQLRRELIDLTRHHFGPEGPGSHHLTDHGPAAEGEPGLVGNRPDPTGEPSSLLEWAEFHEQVGQLPQAERETFDLLWYQGLTQKEAAAVLGVTERTVKNRWRSAKLLLGPTLGEE